ncbi:unnamed protein product [Lactuca saligna]|uniref:Uncharacterized protein n=1 Tax=Lactuca saligna TaxID=75948 RepID=A0AA35YSV3_LACSI|nr:unnamed protein product [Lactuca saligna]
MQIQEILNKLKGIHALEVKLAIQQLLIKVKKLNLVPSADLSRPSSSRRTGSPRQSKNTKFLPPYGTRYIKKELSVGLNHFELERGYWVLISLDLNRRLNELQIDEFRLVKPKILKEVEKFYNGSSYHYEED